MAKDIVNDRINTAQMELGKRAKRLERIVAAAGPKKKNEGFKRGVELVSGMISGQAELLDALVFEAPKTQLEQHRNLMLMTGSMKQSVQEGIKTTTDAIDSMLNTLEQMTR